MAGRTRSGPAPLADSDAHDVRARIYDDVILEWYRYSPGPAGTVPSHSHGEYQLCLCFGSASRYRYRGGWIVVPPGTLSVLMPDEVHTTSEAEDRQELTQYRVLYAGPDQLRGVAAAMGSRRSGLPFFADAVLCDDDLSRRFLRLHVAFEGASAQLGRDIALLSMLGALVRRHARTPDVRESLTGARRAVQVARAYLEDNHAANVSLLELEQVAALSAFHLSRLFQQEVGMPPHAYQIQVRIAHAKRLLLRGLPVSRVASETGFFDLSHFTRHFKRLVGVAPGRYADDRKNVHYRGW
jgi:AraC-like DNA-binding protein